ncbi:DegT/DnrJ/EryC1/StrS family aminotransferase [Paludibacterium yongneupense]|uniref:DegT/DnrJ/EryC1/StrS family aminotransferase n=1 Tax=Paludibacterium yongneupense TaxID=400061 RepID=UPI000418B8EB|nr:DegT/DnrJ/EryC1/StrS family aminotransferase [Paludibacterium yongneupense]
MSAHAIALSRPDYGELEARMLRCARDNAAASDCLEAFENEFAAAVGRVYALAVCSGRVGMWLALRACALGRHDEVILSPRSWLGFGRGLLRAELRPLFADIDPESGCLDPERIEALIGPRTRAILACNSNGHPADWGALGRLARRHDLVLLEDSSEAIASRYLGRDVGTFGDIAVFDFSVPGALCCGQGGMVVTDDPELASALFRLRADGVLRASCPMLRAPERLRLPEPGAALGLAQLERLFEMLAERKRVESDYCRRLQGIPNLRLPRLGMDVDEVHWTRYVVDVPPAVRPAVVRAFGNEAIECATAPAWGGRAQPPRCRQAAASELALPFHSRMNAQQVERVARVLERTLAMTPCPSGAVGLAR